MDKRFVIGIFIALLISVPAFAAKITYTPSQLRHMVESGHPPAQKKQPTVVSKHMSFAACVATVRAAIDAVQPEYPTDVIVNTSMMFMGKMWANDGVVLMTCSKPDRKLVLLRDEYQ
ncbi:MAG: hypothetical protein ACRES7_11165 [Gammaproteobacteria bacterium]